ncbi:hypothetical protein F7734_50575 [Scytonema sp. UIC 10036]|uniref:hypothetical protein n=1 Tax=Scytonema sp. UIC 10036 TaxID=2304196 RepID=UPI0012DA8F53|nr:hypothetical protein [Scytonema sp. UIC 10036]MUH00088.1 hypothetical protein [Scytonema sp. UIC 10036]
MIFLNFYVDDILPKLGSLIKEKHLTETLEALECLGYYGDSSVALLIYLQQEVGL